MRQLDPFRMERRGRKAYSPMGDNVDQGPAVVVARFITGGSLTLEPRTILNPETNRYDKTVLARNIVMSATTSEPFAGSTPSGRIEMSITNERAGEFFELGAEYEVTFRKITPGKKVVVSLAEEVSPTGDTQA